MTTWKFEVGDIVSLKSGGPPMTVEEQDVLDKGKYECKWFAGKKLERGRFSEETLKRVEDGDE